MVLRYTEKLCQMFETLNVWQMFAKCVIEHLSNICQTL